MGKNNLAERLMELNEKIDSAKTDKAEAEGRLKSVKDTLNKKFNCTTIEEAKSLYEKKLIEKNKKLSTLKKGIEDLEEKFE